MERIWPRRALRTVLLVAALACWLYALCGSGALLRAADTVSLRYATGGVDASAVTTMLEDSGTHFAAWRQIHGEVTAQDRRKSLRAIEANL